MRLPWFCLLLICPYPGCIIRDVSELKEKAGRAYRAMCMARAFDLKLSSLYKAGKIFGGVFLGKGHEAISAASAVFLKPGQDVYNPFIREMAGRCAWDEGSVLEAARSYFGSVLGCMGGKDGNVHWGLPAQGIPAPVSHLGAMISVVAGMMFAKRMQGINGCVGVVNIGDGATSVGAAHEGFNLIAVEKLPVVIIVSNNQYAYSTPNSQEFACASLADRGRGYGLPAYECDGTDLLQTLDVMQRAISAARCGEGPQWVVADTLRMCGHGEHDDASYIPDEVRQKYAHKDPLDVARRELMEQGWLDEQEDASLQAEVRDFVQKAFAQAQREATPNPQSMDWSAVSWKPVRT